MVPNFDRLDPPPSSADLGTMVGQQRAVSAYKGSSSMIQGIMLQVL